MVRFAGLFLPLLPWMFGGLLSAVRPVSAVLLLDNFSHPALNRSVWDYDIGDGCNINLCGWGNQEKQWYDAKSAQSGYQGRYLRITARRIGNTDRWTSAKLTTRDRFTFRYGRVDVRVRFPSEDGAFPAVWMMPQESFYGGWPNSGEIDIAEYQSVWKQKFRPNRVRTPGSLHYAERHGDTAMSFWAHGNQPDLFHTYSMIWRPNSITFEVDGQFYGQYRATNTSNPNNWPYNRPFYLILNLAVGPGFGTQPARNLRTMTMDVDWIRVTPL